MKRPELRQACFGLVAALALALPHTPSAQTRDSIEFDAQPDQSESIWFVPELSGGWVLEASLGGGLSSQPATPGSAFSVGLGWRHYFEGHGRLGLRGSAIYENGGALDGGIFGTSHRLGIAAAFGFRGITPNYLFGGLGLFVDAGVVSITPPKIPSNEGLPAPETGSQFSVGLEAPVGSLVVISPYLWAEVAPSASVTTVNLPSLGAVEVWARFTFRLEWSRPKRSR